MKIESEVEILIDETEFSNPDFRLAFGEELAPNPTYYRYRDEYFSYLAGSVGWPQGIKSSGCVLVLGITRADPPVYKVLEVVYPKTPRDVFTECHVLRKRFGFNESSALFRNWAGDNKRFSSVESEFNSNLLEDQEERHGVFIAPPADFEKTNSDEIYLATMQNIVADKRLDLSKQFFALFDALSGMTPEDTKLVDSPDVFALASSIYELESSKPWISREISAVLDDENSGSCAFNLD